jgi:MFS family permease
MDAGTNLTYSPMEKRLVALSAMLGYCLDFYNVIIMAFLFSAIEKSLSMTLVQAGVVIAMTLAASVVGGVLVGVLGDRIGRKNALMISLVLIAIGALLSACAWNFVSLLVFRILAGIGVGGEWGAGIVLFNEVWDRRHRGLGSGIIQAMSAAGLALASVVSAFTLSHFSADAAWRIAIAFGGLPIILTVFVRANMPESKLWAAFKERERRGELPPDHQRRVGPISGTFRVKSGRYFVVGMLMVGGFIISYQSATVFTPLLMERVLGASPQVVRNAVLVWAAFVFAANVLAGYFGDLVGRKLTVIFSTLITIVGFLAIYATGAGRYPDSFLTWPLFWAYVLWGLGQGGSGQFGPWLAELYPVEFRTTATSTIYTAGRCIGSVAPYTVPVLAAAWGNLLQAMMFGLVGAVLSLLMSLLLPETAGRRFDVVEDWDAAEQRGRPSHYVEAAQDV